MGGTSTATVGTKTPVKKGATTDEALAQLEAKNAADRVKPVDQGPLTAPTLTDETLMKARKAQYLRMTSGMGNRASYLSGEVGDLTAPKLTATLRGK